MKTYINYISGKFVDNENKTTQELYNPTTGEISGKVALSSKEDVQKAVLAAQDAFSIWKEKTPLVRARIMMKFCMLIWENVEKLAKILSQSHGKVLADAKGEIIRGLEVVEFASGAPHLLKGERSSNVGTGVDCWNMQQPLGVVAGITPFNFPFMVPLWMHGIAIFCGNCFILKPSEKDPQISNVVAELYKEAGLPDGVFNVINGDRKVVDALIEEPNIEAISFVGSTPIARSIYEKSALQGKRVQALGGAKNHMVIMPDADLDLVVSSLLGSAYGSAGERCMAISVAVAVGNKTADELVSSLAKKLSTLTVGAPLATNPESEMGPLISKEHRERVLSLVNSGVEEGADIVVDGRNFKLQGYENGFFLGPCLFDNVRPEMKIYQEEIFGPVLSVVRVENYTQALDLINQQKFANGTAIFTKDGSLARDFSERVQIGMVGVNVPIPVPMAFYSFGGWKNSIFGDLNMHGKDGIRFYTKMKTVTTRWPKTALENQFIMPTMK